MRFPKLSSIKIPTSDIFVTGNGRKIFSGANPKPAEPQKTLYTKLMEGTTENRLEDKTQEYYEGLFVDIDNLIAERKKYSVVDNSVDFFNKRTSAHTKIYEKGSPDVVEVTHFSPKHLDDASASNDIKIYDLGNLGGLLKATVIKPRRENHLANIHAVNSKIEEFIDGKFVHGTPTLDKNKKLTDFIGHYFNSYRSSGIANFPYSKPYPGTAASDVYRKAMLTREPSMSDSWVSKPKEAESNALCQKTQEYYDDLFGEIDCYLSSRNNLMDNCVEFFNPATHNTTKVYPVNSYKLVKVETPLRYYDKVNGNRTVYDLGDAGGILKSDMVKYNACIDGTKENSNLKVFDKKTGFQEQSENLNKIYAVKDFINRFYSGRSITEHYNI